MGRSRVLFAILLPLLCSAAFAHAGTEAINRHLGGSSELVAPGFEIAAETSYLLGSIANPNSYEFGAFFVTVRWRFGVNDKPGLFRGYHQVYLLGMAEPIFRGPETHYFGISAGLRYNFVQP